MALLLTVVIAIACLGDLASSVPVHQVSVLQEIIEELIKITQNQAPLCNGSMVWSVNLTGNEYCAAMEALSNVSNCRTIHNAKRLLDGACKQYKAPASQVSSLQVRDTKIELTEFIKNLREHLRSIFRHGLLTEA
ncbi:interleukin-13 [Orycteropus afer afer]|uniref:Interleukin-13 n=1 Tax=Orycteropus afer afer TaxID=1230840 RepID=A0A8B7A229_ORYAF|nr:interleukin-13 [Orycteropus afer afer]